MTTTHTDLRIPDEVLERMIPRIRLEDSGCWVWTGPLTPAGYGKVHVRSGADRWTVRVHRAAYLALVGPIPDGLTLDHLCRNKACVNPDHLEAVTVQENIARGYAARSPRHATHCKRGHLWSEENTYTNPDGYRVCRACTRARQRGA